MNAFPQSWSFLSKSVFFWCPHLIDKGHGLLRRSVRWFIQLFYAGDWNSDSKNIIINQQENTVQSEAVNISDLEELDDLPLT